MEKIKKGVLKNFLIYFFVLLTFAVSFVSAAPPTLSSLSVGKSAVYLDAWQSFQDQQLISINVSDADNDPLTLTCCEDNDNTCDPFVNDIVCTDYSNSPYGFECGYEPVWILPSTPPEFPEEEIRYLRCIVNDSEGNSSVVSTSYQTSLDCQDGNEDPILPALVEGCHMRNSLTLQATPAPFTHGGMGGIPGISIDTNGVTLDCNNNLHNITGAGFGYFIEIFAADVSLKNCDFIRLVINGTALANYYFSGNNFYDATVMAGASNVVIRNNKFFTTSSINLHDKVSNAIIYNNVFYSPPEADIRNVNEGPVKLTSGGFMDMNGITIENNSFYKSSGYPTGWMIKAIIVGDNYANTVLNNLVIKNNYFEDGQVHFKIGTSNNVNQNGTVTVEGNTFFGTDDKPLLEFLDTNVFKAVGGQIDYVFRNNSISGWYNKSAYWDEKVCGSGYPVPVNAPSWLCGVEGIAAIFGQYAKSVKIENNDFKDVQGYVAFLRNINNNGVTVYNNQFVDASGIYVRDSDGANITYNNITETLNIATVEPVFQSLSRFCYFRNANNGICRDNTMTASHGVLFRAREASNNTDVSFNVFNHVNIPSLEYKGNASNDAYYYWGGDTNKGALFQIRGRAGQNIIQNNIINDLPDGTYSFEVTSNGMATSPEVRGTNNIFRYNIFNENVNDFNYELNGATDNIVDDPDYPNYWKKSPVVVSVNCTDAAQPSPAVCEALVEDVRWYDMTLANASIKKGDVVIESDDETFMDYVSLYQHRYNFTLMPVGEGIWTANATIIDTLGGVAEGNTTFYYTYYSTPPEISIDDHTVNEDFAESNYTVDLSANTVDEDNDTKTEINYAVVSESDVSVADCEIVDVYLLNCTLLSIGDTTVVVNASDGISVDEDSFVLRINDIPEITNFSVSSLNRTGMEQYTSAVTFEENETIRFEADVTDVDDEEHWYEWFLDGILKLAGFGENIFEWVTGFFTAREDPYNVTVIITDSNDAKVTQEWSVNVTDVNGPPFFDPSLEDQEVAFSPRPRWGVLYYDVNCSDPDATDTLTYYDNTTKFEINSSTGLIVWEPNWKDIGLHSFEITCSDNNYNVSQSFNVDVKAFPDLVITSTGGTILFSDNNPDAGEGVTITATVYNNGQADASNVEVGFYDGDTLIGTDTLSSVAKDGQETASVVWTPAENGTHVIKAKSDPNNNIAEEDETNNDATKATKVGYLWIGGIVLDGQLSPSSGCRGSMVTAFGDAWYNTTYGKYEKVAGADVSVTIGGYNANIDVGRTIADGTYNFAVRVPTELNAGYHEVSIKIFDGTFETEIMPQNFTVEVCEGPDPAVTYIYSDPSKVLDNMTNAKLKALIRNLGTEEANNVNVEFYDGEVPISNDTVSVAAGGSSTAQVDWGNLTNKNGTRTIQVKITSYPEEITTSNNQLTKKIKVHAHEPHKADFTPRFISFSNEAPYVDEEIEIYLFLYNDGVVDADADIFTWDKYFYAGEYHKEQIEGLWNRTESIPDGYRIIHASYAFPKSGTHNVTVELDPYDKVDEINELNNNLTRQITVKEYSPRPDFTPTSLTFSDDTPKVGQEIDITANVKNIGWESSSTNVSFYTNEQEIGTDEIFVLGEGGTNTTTVSHIFDISGDYTIKVVADPENEVEEAREDNNELSKLLHVYSVADLAIYSENIHFSDDRPEEGDNLTIFATIQNIGEVNVSDFNVSVSRDGGVIDDLEPKYRTVDFIDVNQNVTVNFTWVDVIGNGSHIIRVEVDPELSIDEPHADNIATRAVIVGDFADFYVLDNDVAFNDTLEVNKTVKMDVTVHNGGTMQGSAVVKIYDDSNLVHTENVTVNYDSSTVVSTDWTPNKFDSTLTINVVDVTPQELDYADNTLVKNVHINVAPTLLQNIPDIVFDEDESNSSLDMTDYFDDENDAYLEYSFATNDSNVDIDFIGTIANITSAADWYGSALLSIIAFDDDGANVTSNNFVVVVNPVNDPPEFDFDLENKVATQYQQFNYDIDCSDVDQDTLTYSNNDSEVGINNNTGLITWTPTQVELRWVEITCSDGIGSVSDTFSIDVQEGDTTPPVITDTDNLNNTVLSSGTTEKLVNIGTDENADCEYSTSDMGFSYGSGTDFTTTGGTAHSFTYSGLTDGNTYNVSVKCKDDYDNFNTEDWFISFSVNITEEGEECIAETVSYWKLDENTGSIAGDSVDGNNGTISGATWASAKVNSALSFDGSGDYVSVPDSSAWSFGNNNFAIEFWIKRDGNQQLYDAVVSHWKVGDGYAFIVYFDASNNLNLGVNQNYPLITSSPLDDNTWYHVAVVRDGSTSTKIYLNGVQTGSTYTVNYDMVDSSADLLFGSQQGGTGYFFKGYIDEVAVYNRSLTIDEIQEHYLNSEYYVNGYCEAYTSECGNGVVDVGEGCDDNNTADGDGCFNCIVEGGYACSGIPSSCCTDIDSDGVCDSTDSCNNSYAPSGMVSYWGFEEGSGIKTDDSYDAHDGTLVNGPSWDSGQVGNALSFDGVNDFVRVYDSEDWHFGTDNYTVSFWVKRDGNQQLYDAVVSQWSGSGTNRAFIVYFDANNKLNLGINGNYPVITTDALTDDTWYYVNIVRDGLTSTKMYLNSVQNGSTYTTNYDVSDSVADLLFGSQQGGTGYFFKGSIDEVAVYNRSLTIDEISEHYNNTVQGYGYCQA